MQDAHTYNSIRGALLDKILDLGLQAKSNKVGLVFYGTVRIVAISTEILNWGFTTLEYEAVLRWCPAGQNAHTCYLIFIKCSHARHVRIAALQNISFSVNVG